ncbi:hypothetical protein T484DRAFT_1783657 [Baffinella frigidus]|nr:hypothetical protein T484DRAFT_1783657 [Cryptophyta sp. CCMP2293]
MVDGDSRQRKGKNAGRPAAERAPVSRYASSTDGGGNGNGMQELLAGEDIWWQIRVGDELLERGHFPLTLDKDVEGTSFLSGDTCGGDELPERGHFPVREEWSYTSGHREFHNHWWIATALFSLVYRCAGVPGLVCLRGAMVAVFMRLLLAVFPRTFVRWPLAALCFKILRHRLQLRPETMCVSLFLVLFLVRRRPAFGGLDGANPANPDASLLERIFLPEVMCIWFIVVLVANTHVGMVPFSGLTALILLMDGFIKHPKGKWRSAGIDPVPILRALPV